MTQAALDVMRQDVAQELNKARLRLETLQQSYRLLNEFIFQTVSTAKAQETNEARLEVMTNGMQEIKKYADQEVQKHTHTLGVLAGKLQGIEVAYEILTMEPDDELNEDVDGPLLDDDE